MGLLGPFIYDNDYKKNLYIQHFSKCTQVLPILGGESSGGGGLVNFECS